MKQFAKKLTALFYIYLELSVPAINAARVKQSTSQLQRHQVDNEMQVALSEIDVQEHESQRWGSYWTTCEDRLKRLEKYEKALEEQYEAAMKDKKLSSVEAGILALKAWWISSTLSAATKAGCEWATSRSHNASAMEKIVKRLMEDRSECKKTVKDYLVKAKADGVDKEEAKANVMKIMFSADCKLPSKSEEKAKEDKKTFKEKAKEEDEAETKALEKAKEFEKKLKSNSTSLVEASQDLQFVAVLTLVVYFLIMWVLYALLCTAAVTVLIVLLTMVYLMLKAVFMLALGYTSTKDFTDGMADIIKPWAALGAGACSAYFSVFWGTAIGILGLSEFVIWLGLGTGALSLGAGAKKAVELATAEDKTAKKETALVEEATEEQIEALGG